MPNYLTGNCMCGLVSYVISGDPIVAYYCHCNDCKKSTGSAFHVGLVVKRELVKISGEIKGYIKNSDSGNKMERCFCPNCGSPLFTIDSGAPENIVIKAGSLSTQNINPTVELWTIRKAPWAQISKDIISRQKGKAYEI